MVGQSARRRHDDPGAMGGWVSARGDPQLRADEPGPPHPDAEIRQQKAGGFAGLDKRMIKNMRFFYTCMATSALLFTAGGTGRAQVSPDPYVPCQEMPALMENYQADARAITRFYNSSFYGTRFRGSDAVSPELRARLGALDRQYLNKLEGLDFNALPQECKVDYILFRRDLNDKVRLLAVDSGRYEKVRLWFPFADSIYALERLRRRGHPLDAAAVAREWSDAASRVDLLRAQLKKDSSLDLDLLYEAGLVVADLKRAVGSIHEFY